MPDLKQRLDAVDRVPVDDLWPEIRERLEDAAAGRVTPLRGVERRPRPEAGWRKALTIAAVFALVAATGILLVRSLTSDEVPADTPIEPRPAPAASGTLAYVLDGDVYVADPDGSNAVKIADGLSAEDCYGWSGEYWAEGPMWSPDGRYLAFRRYTDCGNEENPRDVVITDAEGNVVATFPAQGWDIGWSPDSTRVAVWDVLFETIGVYGLDGARQTQLAVPPGMLEAGDRDPVWMADGTSLMIPNVEVPLDGGPPRPLPASAGWTTYSPDGSHVAYVAHRSLTVARSDGSEPREVFGDWAGDPTWSPTGDAIAFTSSGDGPGLDFAQLRVVDVATGSVTLLTEADPGSGLWVIGFSPECDRVLFSRIEDRGRGESSLWSVDVDGSDARLLVAGTTQGDWLTR